MAKYEQRKKGVFDTEAEKIITPVNTVKWRQYERWLKKKEKDASKYPKFIFNT